MGKPRHGRLRDSFPQITQWVEVGGGTQTQVSGPPREAHPATPHFQVHVPERLVTQAKITMSFRISNVTKFAWNETAFVMGVETRRVKC